MADPLSIAASIVAVIQLAGTVVTYLNDIKESSNERNRLLLEISTSRGLLYSLKDLVDRLPSNETWDSTLDKLGRPSGPLDQFRSALERLAVKLVPKRMGSVGRALSWPFVKKDVDETLKTIERLKTLTILALQRDFVKLAESIQDDVQEISRGVKDLQIRAMTREKRELLAWISPLNFWSKQTDIFSGRLERTGEWFLESKEFQNWVNGSCQSLWCRGIPGAGKTVLASVVVDLLNRMYEPDDAGVIFLYCDYKERKQQTAINLLSSMLQQLVQRQAEISESVTAFHQKVLSKHTRPKIDDYFNLISSELENFPKTFIVVDAVDEYLEKDGTRNILFNQLRKLQPRVNLMVTSRHLVALETEVQVDDTIEIRADDEDIERYLEFQIHNNRGLATFVAKYPDLQEKIISTICDSAKGMFLMARLHIDALKKKRTRRDLLEALENLPTKISAIYDEAMQRIKAQDKDDYDLAIKILGWITHAITPLTVQELQHALAVQPGDFDIDDDDLMDEEALVGVCGGLVTIEQQSNIIRLVHYTTEQYFAPKQSSLFPDFQRTISAACITYLSFNVFSKEPIRNSKDVEARLAKYPFLLYAAQNWADHAIREKDDDINEKVNQLLTNDLRVSNAIQVMQHARNRNKNEIQEYSKGLTGLHLATYFRLPRAVKSLLDVSGDLKFDSTSGWTPLHTAATMGDFVISQLFIEHGVSSSSKTQTGWTVLHAAAGSGREPIVGLLLSKHPDVNAQDDIGWAPIHLAGFNGHEDTIQPLLEKGASPDSQDVDGITSMHYAAISDQIDPIKVLLDGGANIDLQTNKGWTALHWAAWLGQTNAAKFLIEKGAGLEVQAKDGTTPMHLAALSGHASVIELLVDSGADAAAQDRTGWTPLHWASFLDKEEAVSVLVKLFPLAVDKKGLTALHWTAFDNNTSNTAQILLQAEGMVDVKGLSDLTALHMAAIDGNEDIVEALLAAGFDIMARDDKGWTALHWAAFNQKDDMVQFLVDKGADAEALDNSGLTALHVAVMPENRAFRGRSAVASLLHDTAGDKHGSIAQMHRLIMGKHSAAAGRMDVVVNLRLKGGEDYLDTRSSTSDSSSDSDGDNGPSFGDESDSYEESDAPAAQQRTEPREAVIERLLSSGARVDSKFWNGRTALHRAAEKGNKPFAKLILDGGADINAKDDAGRTPLFEAAGTGNAELVKLLLDAGADISAVDNMSVTPLQIAEKEGHADVVGMLKQRGG